MRALRHASGGLIALGHSGWHHSRRRFMPVGIGPGLAPAAVGALLTLLIAVLCARVGAAIGLGLLVGACLFIAVLMAFIVAPHIAVAFTIAYFSALPALKVLVTSHLGPTKDIIEIAAVFAAVILALQRRAARRTWGGDRGLLILTLLLIGLYLVDLGSGLTGGSRYGLAWFHGVRLVAEPLVLLLVGLTVANPRKTFRWAVVSLIAAAYGAALLGLLQQGLGPGRLVSLGYSYDKQVRTIGTHLRSFGSFDEPFDYAAMLAFGLAGVLLWLRRGFVASLAVIVIGMGLAVSFVRAAAFSVVALLALLLARRGHPVGAALLLGAAVVSGAAFMFSATQPTPGQVAQAGPGTYRTLNGRTRSWRGALSKPKSWPFGQGVGHYGTAAERAARSRPPSIGGGGAKTAAADSGYLATVSDVGFVGLAVLLALFARIVLLLRRRIARGEEAAWFGLGVIVIFMLDAVLRSSLTGFPTAHVAMLLVGLTLAATSDQIPGDLDRAALPSRRRA